MLAKLTLRPIFRKFKKDRDGTTTIEVAFILPLLMVILIGIIDLSVVMFVNTIVEGGLKDASRVGLTGLDTGAISREQTIANLVNEASIGMVDVSAEDVSSLVYPSFGDIGMPEPYVDIDGDGVYSTGDTFTDINGNGDWDDDMGTAGLGGPGEIVLYTLDYNWNLLSGTLIPILDGVIPLSATMVVRNEPFNASSSGG